MRILSDYSLDLGSDITVPELVGTLSSGSRDRRGVQEELPRKDAETELGSKTECRRTKMEA